MGDRSGSWMSFLTRHTLEDATSYQQAKHLLVNTTLLAPAYFILGGTKAHEVIYGMVNPLTPTVAIWVQL